MKKINYLFYLWIAAIPVFAQNVGINNTGTTPHISTILDLNTGNTFTSPNGKGLLVPNVALTGTGDALTVGSPATSLFVYNTATASTGSTAVTPGFYYWDGTKWVAFVGNGSKNWSLTGNTGTIAGTNFLGTTDAIDLVFKTNNTEQMRILSGGNVGINNISPSEKLDVTGNVRFSGDLRPNNLPGTTGQVLTSKGANTSPVWVAPSSIIKTYSTFAIRTLIPASGSGTGWTNVSGLSKSITTTGPAIFIIMTYGSIEVISSAGNSGCEVQVLQNGAAVPNAYQTIDVEDNGAITGTIGLWSFQTIVTVAAAGTYVFSIQAHKYNSAFDNFYAGGNSTAPTSSQNQGALIILEFDQ